MPRPHWHMRVKIVRHVPDRVEEYDTSRFSAGKVYDVNAPLCDLLVLHGYAEPVEEPQGKRQKIVKALGSAVIADEAVKTRRPRKPRPD